jgi:hypothetical protein
LWSAEAALATRAPTHRSIAAAATATTTAAIASAVTAVAAAAITEAATTTGTARPATLRRERSLRLPRAPTRTTPLRRRQPALLEEAPLLCPERELRTAIAARPRLFVLLAHGRP